MDRLVTIDIETTGLNFKRDKILCMSAHNGKKGVIYHTLPEIQEFFNQINKLKVIQGWHNGKFDAKFLIEAGIEGVRVDHDSLIMASMFNFTEQGLKELGQQVLELSDWGVGINTKHMEKEDPDKRDKYCIKDSEVTHQLITLFTDKIKSKGIWDYYSMVMDLNRFLLEIELKGVRVDMETLSRERSLILGQLCASEGHFLRSFEPLIETVMRRVRDEKISKIKVKTPAAIERHRQLIEKEGFNIRSTPQVAELLKEIHVFPKDKEGHFTTSSKSLRYHIEDHPCVTPLMQYRGIKKTSEFLTSWESKSYEGRLFGSYNLFTTDTGRISSAEPNLQQVPKLSTLRGIFRANEGKVWTIADYAQVEPRIMAHLTQDPRLMAVFLNDEDIYGYLAVWLLGCSCKPGHVKSLYPKSRDVAKALTLAIMYGMGARALSFHLTVEQGIPTTKAQAKGYLKAFYDHFPQVRAYQEQIGYQAFEKGYIKGIFGRYLWLPRSEARHKAFNYINQNAASEICAFSQLKIKEDLKDIAELRLITHDEVCYECDESDVDMVVNCLTKHMVSAYKGVITVPLKIEVFVGDNWGAKQ